MSYSLQKQTLYITITHKSKIRLNFQKSQNILPVTGLLNFGIQIFSSDPLSLLLEILCAILHKHLQNNKQHF